MSDLRIGAIGGLIYFFIFGVIGMFLGPPSVPMPVVLIMAMILGFVFAVALFGRRPGMMSIAPFTIDNLPDGTLIEWDGQGNVLAFLPDGSAKLYRIFICETGLDAVVTDIPPVSIKVQ